MALFVYMTAGSAEEADRIAGDLVENRLAACVNIMAPIRSVYAWKGELCRSEEIPLSPRRTTTGSRRWPPACVGCTVTKPPAS